MTVVDVFVVMEVIEQMRRARALAEFGGKTAEDARQEAIDALGTPAEEQAQPRSAVGLLGQLTRLELAKAAFDDVMERLG